MVVVILTRYVSFTSLLFEKNHQKTLASGKFNTLTCQFRNKLENVFCWQFKLDLRLKTVACIPTLKGP